MYGSNSTIFPVWIQEFPGKLYNKNLMTHFAYGAAGETEGYPRPEPLLGQYLTTTMEVENMGTRKLEHKNKYENWPKCLHQNNPSIT